jgi:hypothetical protein
MKSSVQRKQPVPLDVAVPAAPITFCTSWFDSVLAPLLLSTRLSVMSRILSRPEIYNQVTVEDFTRFSE